MKDHEIRELVNQLRDVAIKYHGAGQLREQIARTVRVAIPQAQSDDDCEPTDDERIMAIDGIHSCERCGDEGWVVGEMGITRCACGQADNSPVIGIEPASGPDCSVEVRYVAPPGYVMVSKDLLSELRDWAHPEIEKYCEMWEGRRDSEFPALRKVITDADALLAASPQPQNAQQNIPEIIPGWIPVSERMPEPGILVLVYTPPQPDDYPGDVRIGFDYIDPDGDDPTYWFNHGENYEEFYCVACDGMTGPSEKAPYTHWIPLPAAPQEVKGE
ncbi:DUF551 domain-containing protein [Klebsiella variicola]